MKKHLQLKMFLLFLCLLGGVPRLKADHMVGSDITWKCIGKDTFEVQVTDYRDCNGIPFVNTPLTVTSKCGSSSFTVSGSSSGGQDITPTCKKSCTRCTDRACKFPYGIQQYFITCKVILPAGCCDFKLSWNQCCRSAGITTGATWNDYYIEAALNACTIPCDNSPYFTNPPVAVYCKGQCIEYNQGANDVDKNGKGEADSLVYSLTPPLQSAGNQVNWASGYSYLDPLAYDGFSSQDRDGEWNPPKTCKGFHMDPATGDIRFKATKEEVTVLAIQVDEWRKDSTGKAVKIGTIRRDLQVIIMDCPDNRPPNVSGINGTNLTQMNMCAERTTCFTIKTYDPDQDDSVTLSWNKQIPAASFTADNKATKWPTGHFCWTPQKSDIRTYPYYFVVTAVDNACPVPGRTAKTFAIYVLPPPEANYSALLDSCGWVKFSAVRSGKDAGTYTYTWSGDGAKRSNGTMDRMFGFGSVYRYKYTAGGTYHYSLTLKNTSTGCTTVYNDSVVIKDYVGVDLPKDTVLCRGSSLTITANAHGGKGTKKFLWNTGSNSNTITAKITKDTVFVVTVWDATLCSNYDSMKVTAHAPPVPNLGKDVRACKGDSVWLSPNLKGMKSTNWVQITSGGPVSLGSGDKWPVTDSGNYVVNVTDSINCTGTDTIKIRFNPLVRVYKQNIDACRFDGVTMDAGTGGATTTWAWYDLTKPSNKPVASTKTYTVPVVLGDKFYKIVATQTLNGITCVSMDTISLYSHIKPVVTIRKLPAQCYGNSPLDLSSYGDYPPGGKGVWYCPANKLAVINNSLYIDQLKIGIDTLTYTVYDKYNCKSSASTTIEVDSLPKVFAGKDITMCTADSAFYFQGLPVGGTWVGLNGAKVYNGNTPKAYFLASDVTDFTTPSVFVYTYISKSASKCSSSDTMMIKVLQTPTTKAGSYGPYCVDTTQNNKAYLSNGVPAGGVWTSDPKQNLPASALQFDNAAQAYYFDPNKADSGNWRLVYTATADGVHCAVSDTTNVKVLPQPRFSISVPHNNSFCISEDAVPINTNQGRSANVAYIIDDNKTGGKGLIGTNFDPGSAGPGIHKIKAIYTSPSGCKNSAVLYLTVNSQSTADILNKGGFCEAASYPIKGDTLNSSFVKWSTPDGQMLPTNTINTVFKPDTAAVKAKGGRFSVSILAGNGGACKDTSVTKDFIIYSNPVIAFDANNLSGCAPLSVTLTSTSTVKRSAISYYVWDFGDGTKDSTELDVVSHVYKQTGKYSVSLKAVALKGGCYNTLTKNNYIKVNPVPIVDFLAVPSYTTIALPKIQFASYDDKGMPYSQNVDDSTKYVWNFGDTKAIGGGTSTDRNPIHIYGDTGKYTVSLTATNKYGCVGENVKLNYIDIRPEIIVFIPNVFKPNGHSKSKINEKFSVVISSNATFEMNIYNRWGELMYHSLDKNDGWDGNYHNAPAQEGVYIYVVKAQGLDGKDYTYTGSITLLR